MEQQIPECDVIMKGGITSGVVYPDAVLALKDKFRFRCIGGTSAGAIAAAVTAAAEYARGDQGFDRLAEVPHQLSKNLLGLFQPPKNSISIFKLIVALTENNPENWVLAFCNSTKPWSKIFYLLLKSTNFLGIPLAILSIFPSIVIFLGAPSWTWLETLAVGLNLILFIIVLIGSSAVFASVRMKRLLLEHDYGLCPGSGTTSGNIAPLSDWLADLIDHIAGLPEASHPLTFGQLEEVGEDKASIDLRTVTTNLNLRRPHTLPDLGDSNYYFNREEWYQILPKRIVDFMIQKSEEADAANGNKKNNRGPRKLSDGREVYKFPQRGDLPVVVAARMSLSFPFLISAVPLYRIDHPNADTENDAPVYQRVLFSDGGLSSNFPIHFFDSLLPTRPTFGIALTGYNENQPKRRVYLPMEPAKGQWMVIGQIKDLPSFVMALFDAAKDWQDQLQSTLAGYRERIVRIHLKENEGGMNLSMSEEKVVELGEFGSRAGDLLCSQKGHVDDDTDFDFKDHQWRRFLVLYAALEQALEEAESDWGSVKSGIHAMLKDPPSYGSSNAGDRGEIFDRMEKLMTFVDTDMKPALRNKSRLIPKPPCKLSITPYY